MVKKPSEEKYSGLLDGWFETGSEGTHWVLDNGSGTPIFVEKGDHLKVYGKDGNIAFEGTIVPDTKTGWKHYLGHPDQKAGQPMAFGHWNIHWTQKGWDVDEWARLFIWHWFKDGRGAGQYSAELTKKKKPR